MSGLLVLLLIVGGLVVLDAAARVFGVDSRMGSSDPRSPAHPPGIS